MASGGATDQTVIDRGDDLCRDDPKWQAKYGQVAVEPVGKTGRRL
jgi:hypothetical protein